MLKLLLVEYKDKLRMQMLIFKRFGMLLVLGLILLFWMTPSLTDNHSLNKFNYLANKWMILLAITLFFALKTYIFRNTNIHIYFPTFVHFYTQNFYKLGLVMIIRLINYLISRSFLFYFLYKIMIYIFGDNLHYFITKEILFLFIVTDIFSESIKFICSFTLFLKYSFIIKTLSLLIFVLLAYFLNEKVFLILLAIEIVLIPIILKNVDTQKLLNYSKIIYKSNWGFARGDWGLLVEVGEEYKKLIDFNEKKSCDLALSFPFNAYLCQFLIFKRVYSRQLILLLLITVLSVIILPKLQLSVQLYCYFIIHSFMLFYLLLFYLMDTKEHIYFYMHRLNHLKLTFSALPFVLINIFLNFLLLAFLQQFWYYKVIWYLVLDSLLFFVLKIFWQNEKIKFLMLCGVIILQGLLLKF
ncbi:hypothetical protein [Anaerocellum diazotrophicum]|uniref:hypothetical protein n=1 Tax=Caldicellulosiruptor diazotrophicus TaxID=2806205 RepID=UPI001A928244|nr:hypothetical protein [Caldicellulosiruptor diazotrophicus]